MDELSLGDRELDVMTVLWELGDGTVTEVREKLPADLAYTTVLTILRKLEAKGLVKHKVEGKAHRYIPRVAQKNARRTVLGRLIDKLFDEMRQQLLRRSVEQLVDESSQHRPPRALLGNAGDVAMRFPFDDVPDEAFRLELAEDGQDGGVCEVRGQLLQIGRAHV